jgi:hypothetical protein
LTKLYRLSRKQVPAGPTQPGGLREISRGKRSAAPGIVPKEGTPRQGAGTSRAIHIFRHRFRDDRSSRPKTGHARALPKMGGVPPLLGRTRERIRLRSPLRRSSDLTLPRSDPRFRAAMSKIMFSIREVILTFQRKVSRSRGILNFGREVKAGKSESLLTPGFSGAQLSRPVKK